VEQQIAEIDGVERLQPRLVFGVERRALAVGERAASASGPCRGQAAVLPAVDHGGQLPRGPAFFVDAGGVDQLLHQPHWSSVSRMVKFGLQARKFGVAAQDLHADRVERAEPGMPSTAPPMSAPTRSSSRARPCW
jgi:hypothetical protein